MENIIVTEGVKQSFPVASGGEFVALQDISIQIPEGKLTILRGRSGSGKTTLRGKNSERPMWDLSFSPWR